jgi:hypothetical protein
VRLDPDDEWIDTAKPIMVSLFGIWSKKSGYGRVLPGGRTAERLVWQDKSVGSLARAKDAESTPSSRNRDDSADAFVAGPELRDAKQVTNERLQERSRGAGRGHR